MQHELDKYLCVVEAGSFSGAAKTLHISQPALSIAIKNLEKSLGTELLMRRGRSMVMTEAGEVVYLHAKNIRLAFNNLQSELAEEITSTRTFKVGMIDSLGDLVFARSTPSTIENWEVTIDSSSKLIELLSLDQLDLIVAVRQDKEPRHVFNTEPLGKEKFIMVTSPGRLLGLRQSLRKGVVSDYLSYDRSSTTAKRIASHFEKMNLVLDSKFHSTSPDLIRLAALKGRGTALLPASKVRRDIQSGRLVAIKQVGFEREVAVTTLRDKFITGEMRELINGLKARLG